MKMLILFMAMSMLLAACDQPARTRNGIYNTSGANNLDSGNGSNTTGGTSGGTEPWNGGSTTGSTSGGGALGTGFENCNITPTGSSPYAASIGYTAVCQSTVDETTVKVRSTIGDTSARNCLVPTYKDTAGSSTYIGQPQCYYPQENVTTQGKLYKNRTGVFGGSGVPYSQLPLNGLMIMKENSLNSFFNCMNAIPNFRDQRCPYGASTAPYYLNGQPINCTQLAQSYMTQLCNDFKATNPYLDIRLRP